MPLAENVLFGGGGTGSPVFLCVRLFAETHLQPLGAALGGRGCVDGKDGV
ncbi:MAG: hypothetical protein N2171_00810 [Clostridia bacterium]|nr:hypothetical protein [Clostridia bacterium]